jgi:mycothiol system anti-sigma-R factor
VSCGQPHDTDCADVLSRVYEYLDGELDSEWFEDIRQHLDECSPCLRQFGLEQMVKALVARSCGLDEVPEGLRVKVQQRLHAVSVELTQVEFRIE